MVLSAPVTQALFSDFVVQGYCSVHVTRDRLNKHAQKMKANILRDVKITPHGHRSGGKINYAEFVAALFHGEALAPSYTGLATTKVGTSSFRVRMMLMSADKRGRQK